MPKRTQSCKSPERSDSAIQLQDFQKLSKPRKPSYITHRKRVVHDGTGDNTVAERIALLVDLEESATLSEPDRGLRYLDRAETLVFHSPHQEVYGNSRPSASWDHGSLRNFRHRKARNTHYSDIGNGTLSMVSSKSKAATASLTKY